MEPVAHRAALTACSEVPAEAAALANLGGGSFTLGPAPVLEGLAPPPRSNCLPCLGDAEGAVEGVLPAGPPAVTWGQLFHVSLARSVAWWAGTVCFKGVPCFWLSACSALGRREAGWLSFPALYHQASGQALSHTASF